MTIQVKPGYTNPLNMMGQKRASKGINYQANDASQDNSHKVTSLQGRQLQLQSEMLLIKATGSDTGENSAERMKMMEEKLEEVSKDLRTARSDSYTDYASAPGEQLLEHASRIWRA